MIQRKQTVYLLIAFLLIVSNLFFPFVNKSDFTFDAFQMVFKVAQGKAVVSTIYLGIFLILLSGIILTSIFLFKKRPLQMRFTMFSILLSIGFYALLLLYHFWAKKNYPIAFNQYKFTLISPIIAFILCIMAYNGIKHDEKIVKDSDRLR